MILLIDSEGPDQTVQADLGLCCPHMPEDMFSHGMAQYDLSVLNIHLYHSLGIVSRRQIGDISYFSLRRQFA